MAIDRSFHIRAFDTRRGLGRRDETPAGTLEQARGRERRRMMADEWYSPNRKLLAVRTERTVGELLWEVHVDHAFWRAELFDEEAYGFDVRLFRGGELFESHRWANRE